MNNSLTQTFKKKFQKFFNQSNTIVPIIFLFILSCIFFYPVIFQNKIALPLDALVGAHIPWTELKWEDYPAGVPIKNQEITDAISQFYPWRSLVGSFWRAGVAPLWNQYMFSGTPLLATLHSAALYPFNALYLVLTDVQAWNALIFLQIFLGGVFMYLFLNKLVANRFAAVFGSIAFTFSGYMIAWLEFATGGLAGIWLPVLLLILLMLSEQIKFKWVVSISITFFFIFTAGDFQVPMYSTLVYIMFTLFLWLKNRKVLFLVYSGIGLVSGILLAAPQLIPTFELYLNSIRTDDPYIVEYFYGLMHWEKLANFLWPDFFGNIVTRNYWGKFGFHEYVGFVGITTIVFAAFSIATKKLKYEVFFTILLVIAMLFLFPTPFGFLPYKLHIPALGTSSASRLLFLTDFCLATLAAFGIAKMQKEKKFLKLIKTTQYLLLITLTVAVSIIFAVLYIKANVNGTVVPIVGNLQVALKNMIPSSVILLALLVSLFIINSKYLTKKINKNNLIRHFILPSILLTLITFEMLYFAWKNTPFSPKEFLFPTTKIIDHLKQKEGRIAGGIPLNYFMVYGISSAEGYDPIYPERSGDWFSAVNHGKLGSTQSRYGLIHNFASPLINYANVTSIVDYKKDVYGGISQNGKLYTGNTPDRYTQEFQEGRAIVFHNKEAFPYAWIAQNYVVNNSRAEVIESLLKLGANDRLVAVLEKDPGKSFQKTEPGTVTNVSKSFNSITVSLDNASDSLLVIAETPLNGWHAFVNSNEIEIIPANIINQAVVIPKGTREVQFIYRPSSYTIGVAISLTTVALFLFILLLSYKKTLNS